MNDCSKWAQNHQFWRSLINFGQEKLSCFNKPKSAKWNQGSHQRFSFRWKNIIPRSRWKVHFYDVKSCILVFTDFGRNQTFLYFSDYYFLEQSDSFCTLTCQRNVGLKWTSDNFFSVFFLKPRRHTNLTAGKVKKLGIDFQINPSAREEKITSDRNFWSPEKLVRNTIRSSILNSLWSPGIKKSKGKIVAVINLSRRPPKG